MTHKKRIYVLCTFILMSVLMTTTAFAYPKAFPTNHIMANNIFASPSGAIATDGILSGLSGNAGTTWSFKTVDQLTCSPGKFNLKMQITRADGKIIVATNPMLIDSPNNGYVHTQTAEWRVLFPDIGWYRYEVLIDDQPMAFYYFLVSFNIAP